MMEGDRPLGSASLQVGHRRAVKKRHSPNAFSATTAGVATSVAASVAVKTSEVGSSHHLLKGSEICWIRLDQGHMPSLRLKRPLSSVVDKSSLRMTE
jgi:hypothetical protein